MIKVVFICDCCKRRVELSPFEEESRFLREGHWFSLCWDLAQIDGWVHYPRSWEAIEQEDGKRVLLCSDCLKQLG